MLLECQNIHYSAFLAIKSYKKANFPPLELLNQVCLQFSESSNLHEAISLLTCAVGDSEPSLFCFFDHKISQKSEFPSFWASESGISPVKWVIQSTWSHFITYLCFWRLIALVIPLFWPWNWSKRRISLLLSLWNQVYLAQDPGKPKPSAQATAFELIFWAIREPLVSNFSLSLVTICGAFPKLGHYYLFTRQELTL